MDGLQPAEVRVVRKLATLLRLADSLDRSHRQTVLRVQGRLLPSAVVVKLRTKQPVDLELWDAAHESALFRRVFGRKLIVQVERASQRPLRRGVRVNSRLAARVAVARRWR
jgi:exopolyphosphatase/guanosine-5'-triphosphate,3'-diphosphate pyrophosphatase